MAFLREPLACSQDVPHAAGKWQCFLDDNSSHNRPVPPAPLLERGKGTHAHPTGGGTLHHNTQGPRKRPTARLSLQSDNKIQHVVQLHIGRCPKWVGGGNEGVVITSWDTGCCSLGGPDSHTGGRQDPGLLPGVSQVII